MLFLYCKPFILSQPSEWGAVYKKNCVQHTSNDTFPRESCLNSLTNASKHCLEIWGKKINCCKNWERTVPYKKFTRSKCWKYFDWPGHRGTYHSFLVQVRPLSLCENWSEAERSISHTCTGLQPLSDPGIK